MEKEEVMAAATKTATAAPFGKNESSAKRRNEQK